MFHRSLSLVAACVLALATLAPAVQAATVEFVPTNDSTGFTTGSGNNGYSSWRGVGFEVTSNQTINSAGLFHDLIGINLEFSISEISSLTGSFTRDATVVSGSRTVSTSGSEWIDFSFADTTLVTGTNYLLEFRFDGNANSHFFYNNADTAWNQGAYAGLEGTLGTSFSNTVVAAFRVSDQVPAVPLPAGLPLLLTGIGGLVLAARRRTAG